MRCERLKVRHSPLGPVTSSLDRPPLDLRARRVLDLDQWAIALRVRALPSDFSSSARPTVTVQGHLPMRVDELVRRSHWMRSH